MKKKRTILYLLLGLMVLIYIYNYILPQAVHQSAMGRGMGMGEHMNNYWNTGYSFAGNYSYQYVILIIIAALTGLIFIDIIFKSSKDLRCSKCNMKIENDKWKICPECGSQLSGKKS